MECISFPLYFILVTIFCHATCLSSTEGKVRKPISSYQVGDVTSQEAESLCNLNTSGQLLGVANARNYFLNDNNSNTAPNTTDSASIQWLGNTNESRLLCDVNICRNNGQCVVNGTTATEKCLCTKGFKGPFCEIESCIRTGCEKNGTCSNNLECECDENYFGRRCEYQGCTDNRCHNGGTCFVASGKAYCACSRPFYGRFCELQGAEYIGCFYDTADRVLELPIYAFAQNEPYICFQKCATLGKLYAGLESATACMCGNTIDINVRRDDNFCNNDCPGDISYKCGGNWMLSIYRLNTGDDFQIVENNLLSCTFHPTDPCILKSYVNGVYEWKHSESDKPRLGNYIYFRRKEGQLRGKRAFSGTHISSKIPKCLLFNFNIRKDRKGALEIFVVYSDDKLPNKAHLRLDTDDGMWQLKKYQLKPASFATIVFVGVLGDVGSSVRLGDIRIEDGYCNCSSDICLPDMICTKTPSDGCCLSPTDCNFYDSSSLKLGTLRCTYQLGIPCFMTAKTEVKRMKIGNFSFLSSIGNDTYTVTDTLQSIVLPKYVWLCFNVDFLRSFGFHTIRISQTDGNETLASIMSFRTESLFFYKTYKVHMNVFTGAESMLRLSVIHDKKRYSQVLLGNLFLTDGKCESDIRRCNAIIVQNTGRISTTVRKTSRNCHWLIQVSSESRIHLQIQEFPTAICGDVFLQIVNSSGDIVMRTCGGNVTIDDNRITLHVVKDNTTSVPLQVEWNHVQESCPALYTTAQSQEVIHIPCSERLDSFLCQPSEIIEETSSIENNASEKKPVSALYYDTVIIAICLAGIIVLSGFLIAVLVFKKRIASKNKSSERMVYNNLSESVTTTSARHVLKEEDVYENRAVTNDVKHENEEIQVSEHAKSKPEYTNDEIYYNTAYRDNIKDKDIHKPDMSEEAYDHLALRIPQDVSRDVNASYYGNINGIEPSSDLKSHDDLYDHTTTGNMAKEASHSAGGDIYSNLDIGQDDHVIESSNDMYCTSLHSNHLQNSSPGDDTYDHC